LLSLPTRRSSDLAGQAARLHLAVVGAVAVERVDVDDRAILGVEHPGGGLRSQRGRCVLAHEAEQAAVELSRLVEPVGDDVDVVERLDVHVTPSSLGLPLSPCTPSRILYVPHTNFAYVILS